MSYSTSSDQSTMEVADSQKSRMDASSVPDLVRIGQIPTNTAIDIETDILDPVVNTESLIRFQFQNKGILHSNSKIILRLGAQSNVGFFPLGVGVHSLIQRARLSVGTKTISEIDDFSHYIAYKSMFLSNEHQKEREQFVSGRQIAHRPYYFDGTNADFASSELTEAKTIGLDNGQALESSNAGAMDVAGDLKLKDHCKTNASFGPEFCISLQDLFPFLYQNQLPLYMMTEPVSVELTLSAQSLKRVCIQSGQGTGQDYPLDLTATQLVADYQYFPQEMMNEYAEQNATMSFSYMDYRLAKRSINVNASGSEAQSTLIFNVGGAGRLVTKVFTGVADTTEEASLLNNYRAVGQKRTYTGTPATDTNRDVITNLKYNDHFLYPVDIRNPAIQFSNLVQAEGMVPFVTRDEYANEGGATTLTKCEGYAQGVTDSSNPNYTAGITNQFSYRAYKLNRNERINSRGIELYDTYEAFRNVTGGALSYTLRAYVEILRVATLTNGKMEVYYA